jgi:hypothetical protein
MPTLSLWINTRRIIAVAMTLSIIVAALWTSSFDFAAAATKKDGKRTLTVTPSRQLSTDGARIRVIGKNFDPRVGIYVALCVTPQRGSNVAPGPCGGGINIEGTDAASAWISSNPPSYGKSLATPYRKGGRFAVNLTVSPMIGDIDCRATACAVVTRADHLRSFDRSADLFVPVTFAK